MLLAFELSMPSKGSWDGKWTGEGKKYVVIRKLEQGGGGKDKGKFIESNGPYHHAFGDGWVARVSAYCVTHEEAKQLRKKTAGFCGYEWMIDSIMKFGDIRVPVVS